MKPKTALAIRDTFSLLGMLSISNGLWAFLAFQGWPILGFLLGMGIVIIWAYAIVPTATID